MGCVGYHYSTNGKHYLVTLGGFARFRPYYTAVEDPTMVTDKLLRYNRDESGEVPYSVLENEYGALSR